MSETLIEANPNREAWRVTYLGQDWFTDGYAAFPSLIPGWVAVDRKSTDLGKVLDERLEGMRAGKLKKVVLGPPRESQGYTVRSISSGVGFDVDDFYASRVPPEADWYHDGALSCLVAMVGDRVVAVVMPIYDAYAKAG